ncbi:DUF3592 domain-containing protein [Nonomuraea sp. NPDC000554]|uniref:DUF3592 domain-containing protein n=1 Tax=Nonomuraea sp. NPDC000554 TaxID=3154259 RepID=UPI00332F4B22
MMTIVAGFVFVATALGCLVFAVRERRLISRLQRYGVHGWGTVTRAVVHDTTQHPVIAFTDHAGHHIEFTPQVAGIGLRLTVGQQVPIAYLDGQPQAARVFTARYRVLPSVLTGMGGLIFLVAGIAVILAGNRP